MTVAELAAVIRAAQEIQRYPGVLTVTPGSSAGTVHLHAETLAEVLPSDARVEPFQPCIDGHTPLFPWRVIGSVDGVTVFAIMSNGELERYFPSLALPPIPEETETQEAAATEVSLQDDVLF